MVNKNLYIIIEVIDFFSCLGPRPESECDAAVASLKEMGFSEVK
jgi:hypothetical protein